MKSRTAAPADGSSLSTSSNWCSGSFPSRKGEEKRDQDGPSLRFNVRREVPSRSYQRSPTISSSIFFVEMEEGEKSLSLYRWSHCHFLPPFLLVKGRRTLVTVWEKEQPLLRLGLFQEAFLLQWAGGSSRACRMPAHHSSGPPGTIHKPTGRQVTIITAGRALFLGGRPDGVPRDSQQPTVREMAAVPPAVS